MSIFISSVSAETVQQILPDPLILAIEVDKYKVSDSLAAYQLDGHLFLPLCQLANELTILLDCDITKQYISGFILKPERAFELNIKQKTVLLNKKALVFNPRLIRLEQDDFYVAVSLIEEWFPIKLKLDLSRLIVTINPLEPLPLQMRIESERAASILKKSSEESIRHYPQYKLPYQIFSNPFIDQTFSVDINNSNSTHSIRGSSTTFITSDFLGMESSLFYNRSQQNGISEDFRFTLGRYDPESKLLGPLRSRSVSLGSIIVPGVNNIANSHFTGKGFIFSNFPLSYPSQFDKYTFEGELLPGWDVELYFNDALVGYQQSQFDGRYRFLDQPLIFGVNRFRLVFHGPQGQIKVEQHTFFLNQSLAKPGEFLYTIAIQQDKYNVMRSLAQFEFGINKTLSMMGGAVALPLSNYIPNGKEQIYYGNWGMRAYLNNLVFSADLASAYRKGMINSFALSTELASIAISLSHSKLTSGFISELFLPLNDPIRSSTKLRADGIIVLSNKEGLPSTIEIKRDYLQSGRKNNSFTGRLTGLIDANTLTNEFTANQIFDQKTVINSLQISRNLLKGTVRGQVNYSFVPQRGITTLALAADYPLRDGYLIGFNIAQTFLGMRQRNYGITLNKGLGTYALRLALGYNRPGEVTIGMQLFTSIGRDRRAHRWLFDSLPRATTGTASIRVFVDKNLNGIMDDDDEPVQGASFILNGSSLLSKTDEKGLIFIDRLPVQIPIDLAVNVASLADPQWYPKINGINFVARPGYTANFDFPLMITSDMEGMVYLVKENKQYGIGDVQLEILNLKKEVIAHTQSASDGYYFFSNIPPGQYFIRVSAEQLAQLDLQPIDMYQFTITGNESNLLKIPAFVLLLKK